jgi:hypothetical protein
MAILIPNKDMPSNCIECFSYYDGYCMAHPESPAVPYATCDEIRQDWCPLIEVQEPKASITREDLEAAGFET